MQLNILYQDKAKNAGDAAHRQGFSTKYWYKRLVAKCGNYFLNVPKQFQFRFSLDEITSNYDLDAIKALFPNAPEVPTEILNTKLAEFNACDQAKVFRGKYEMQFLSQMIKLLLEDSNKNGENRILKQEIKFPFGSQLSIAQAINVFQTYAETPPHLLEYLEEVS